MKTILCLILLVYSTESQSYLLDTSKHILARQKRGLIWSDAGTNWVQLIVGLGLPFEVKRQAVTLGTVIKAFYTLPTNSSVYTNPTIDYERSKRSATRWSVYKMIEDFIDSKYAYGDGKACLLRTICEISHTPIDENTGILAEIVTAVLRPSTTNEEYDHYSNVEYVAAENNGRKMGNCHLLYPECAFSILDRFSKFIS